MSNSGQGFEKKALTNRNNSPILLLKMVIIISKEIINGWPS
jgi:hypothetical protein